MSPPHRLTLVSPAARLLCPLLGALFCIVATGSAGVAGDKLLVRIATTDPATLESLHGLLDPVRVLEPAGILDSVRTLGAARRLDGFALAWGDATAVEAARLAGAPVEILGPRRSDRTYAVVYLPVPEWGPAPPSGDTPQERHSVPAAERFGRILYADSRRAILEYPPRSHDLLCAAFETLPILDRPVVLSGVSGKATSGDLPSLPAFADPFVQALVEAVNADSLLAVVRYLQGLGSRRSPEPECFVASDSLGTMLRRYGIPEVSLFDFNQWSDNVVGVQPGRGAPDELYIICGHYDSYSKGSVAPGADDNGTGTAAVIEAARILGRQQFEATIIYLAVSGEEQGLVGSEAWAAAARARSRDIRGVINLDMVGWRRADDAPDLDVISNFLSSGLSDFVHAAAALYLPGYGIVDGAFGSGNSDQQSFWDHGYPALTFHEDTDTSNPCYHTVQDLVGPSVNDPEFLRHNVQVGVAALAELARPVRVHITHQPSEDPAVTAERYPVSGRIASGSPLVPDSLRLRFRVNGGAFSTLPLLRLGLSDGYAADIPRQQPGDLVEYYLEAYDTEGRHASDPVLAPETLHAFVVGRAVAFHDTFVQDQGWTVGAPGDGAVSGTWTRARPVGTGTQPEVDADGDSLCFVTGNGEPGGAAGEADVDGGRTTLTSPRLVLDRAVTADLDFHYWFADETFPDDTLRVQVSSDDGASWISLQSVSVSERAWRRTYVPRLEDLLPLTGTMRLRFTVADEGRVSLLEAAIDGVKVRSVILPAPPPPPPPPPAPTATRLLTPWPQPFRGSVTIRYDLAEAAEVNLAVFDLRGRRVADLWQGPRSANRYETSWDGCDTGGRPVPSGVYFLRMDAGGMVRLRRIVRAR
jgi:hypothetical protein